MLQPAVKSIAQSRAAAGQKRCLSASGA